MILLTKVNKIKVFIADNHLLIREGIKALLFGENNIHIVGEAAEGKELAAKIQKLKPNVVILDYHLPGFFCIQDIETIYSSYNKVNILIVTTNQNKNDIHRVINYGVNNYIFKACDKDEFMKAVYATAKKERFLCGKVIDAILAKNLLEVEHCEPAHLSLREIGVIKLISEGYTNEKIAAKLSLSFHTIGSHRKNILKKLQLKNSSELVTYSIKTGIINADEK